VSELCYTETKVIKSAVKSDHKAVITYIEATKVTYNKMKTKRSYRKQSPDNHAYFLSQLTQLEYRSDFTSDPQTEFDRLYNTLHDLLNHFYPQRTITVTSR